MAENVLTSMYFLDRDALWEKERPYLLKFDPPEGFAKSNVHYTKQEGIYVEDIRGREKEFTLEQHGFELIHLAVNMQPEDFRNESQLKALYFPVIAEQLKSFLGAERVQVHDYAIRKSHVEFPVSTGQPYEYRQPASIVHIDTTPTHTKSLIQTFNPGESKALLRRRWRYLNVWMPLRGLVRKWPLALCDNRTTNAKENAQIRDLVFPNAVAESYHAHPSPDYRFFYVRNQLPGEAWVFLQSDSNPQKEGALHSSFYNSWASDSDPERESIEVRVLAYFADSTE
ncbi:hypothetical protein ASPWEDRAFT_167886 [Aspergillus wentii DTO 134E9]|uniref:Methyltransferase n=1 Tax=Aspergillus wentii DTO 134E9 TaxID=1073089 RepID=A0A1L9S432_ASPWE|nr:uncharacterized protein ASPWEDRAFT_167886 [Aspergillus wentii DTO 134E9]KAI9930218.1 hypothetical protein MW887_012030 [Aspergillus wentii]OJJ41893.1 hypothetical protein ASPWEDRAFT_167886 [Aspergillus wentii DTO 134E9]